VATAPKDPILMDMLMSDMGGFPATRIFNEDTKNQGDPRSHGELLQGAKACAVKPYSSEEVSAMIDDTWAKV